MLNLLQTNKDIIASAVNKKVCIHVLCLSAPDMLQPHFLGEQLEIFLSVVSMAPP